MWIWSAIHATFENFYHETRTCAAVLVTFLSEREVHVFLYSIAPVMFFGGQL